MSYLNGVDNLQSKRFENIGLGDIITYRFDNEYIITARNFDKMYMCTNGIKTKYMNEIEYMIIDKKTDEYLVFTNKENFINMKEKLNINLEFNYNYITQKLRVNSNEYLNITADCKEINNYPQKRITVEII